MVNLITIKALEPFLSQPDEKLHLSHIARSINHPHPTVRLWLNQLEAAGVLLKSHRGRQTLFQLNRHHPNLIDYLTLAEKQKLLGRCQEEPSLQYFIEKVHKVTEGYSLLFGSATKSLSEANDIDLLIIGKTEKKVLEQAAELRGKKLHLHILSELTEISSVFRGEAIRKHLLIQGSENILGWFLWPNSTGARNRDKVSD